MAATYPLVAQERDPLHWGGSFGGSDYPPGDVFPSVTELEPMHYFNLLKVTREFPSQDWLIKIRHPDWRSIVLRPNHAIESMEIRLESYCTRNAVAPTSAFLHALHLYVLIVLEETQLLTGKLPYLNFHYEGVN